MAETGKACGFERPLAHYELTSIVKATNKKTSNEEFLDRLKSAAKATPILEPPKTKEQLKEDQRLANLAAKQKRANWNREHGPIGFLRKR